MINLPRRRALSALAVACLLSMPALSAATSVVTEWNEEALAAIRANAPRPTVVSRTLFLLSAAQYDAWAAYDTRALAYAPANRSLRRPADEHSTDSQKIAISHAAYRVLVHFYPQLEDTFAQQLEAQGIALDNSLDATTPAGVGNVAAARLLAMRADDGSNQSRNFADYPNATFPTSFAAVNSADDAAPDAPGGAAFNPNHWQPLRVPTGAVLDANGDPAIDAANPASFRDQAFLTPHWGHVTPFALGNPRDVLPSEPPQFGSDAPYTDALGNVSTHHQAWVDQYQEVLLISAALDDREKVIAEFWADGPRSETPPGHWNQLAQGVSMRDQHDIGQDVKMFMAINAAIFDAGIATWYTKRVYDNLRPQSGIRHLFHGQMVDAWGDPELGTQTIPGESWRPYQELTFVTPPFPEYTSGHSAFSAAAAAVLTGFTGSEAFYDGQSRIGKDLDGDGEDDLVGQYIAQPGSNRFDAAPTEPVLLRWNTFKDAADEAGISRLFGGIHIQDGDLRGRELGAIVGQRAWEKAQALFAGNLRPSASQAGAYFDPVRDGEGMTLNFTDDGRVMLTWFTYDLDRRQMWLFGVAAPAEDGSVTIDVGVTEGAVFGQQFMAADVQRQPWGQARLEFVGCGKARLSYTANLAGFGSGTLELSRIGTAESDSCESL